MKITRVSWLVILVTVLLMSLAGCIRHPDAFFTADPKTGRAPLKVSFNASGSYDPDGRIVSYEWIFGDGGITKTYTKTISHTYDKAGEYHAILTVVDNDGREDMASRTIEVFSSPPIADFIYYPPTPAVGESVFFDASNSYDPDGRIVSYEWSFGIGQGTSSGIVATHSYTSAGTYTISLAVTDNDSLVDKMRETIPVK